MTMMVMAASASNSAPANTSDRRRLFRRTNIPDARIPRPSTSKPRRMPTGPVDPSGSATAAPRVGSGTSPRSPRPRIPLNDSVIPS